MIFYKFRASTYCVNYKMSSQNPIKPSTIEMAKRKGERDIYNLQEEI